MMGRRALIFITFLTINLLVAFWYIVAATAEQPNIQSQDLKQKMNIDIDDYKKTPKISKEQAIENAKKTFPDLSVSRHISAQTNLMTCKDVPVYSSEELKRNPGLKAYLENTPVWIISFKGLTIYRSGTNNVTDEIRRNTVHHEENVVIDANTGETLFSFTYR